MKVKKHTLTIGLKDKDAKKQLIKKSQARKIIMDIVKDCTISDSYGCYTHEDGTIVKEKSLRVELLFKADNEVNLYCKLLKEKLNQESIVLSTSYENAMLV